MSEMTKSELEETFKILYQTDHYLYDCLYLHLLALDRRIKRYEKALQTIMQDSELFNTTTKKTTYSYPGKVAKKALEDNAPYGNIMKN